MKGALATEVILYQSLSGKLPFLDWKSKQTKVVRATIDGRIERVKQGLLSDCKSVGDGVLEIRIHMGPGYRVYFALVGTKMLLLLCGGDKATQDADIRKAQKYLADYKERT